MTDDVDILKLSLQEVLELLAKDPLGSAEKIQRGFGKKDRNFRDRLYHQMAVAVAFARGLLESESHLKQFMQDAYWADDKTPPKPKNMLRLVMRYLLKAPSSGAVYDRACTYAKAMQQIFEDDVEPDKIPDAIRDEGGLEKLYAKASARKNVVAEPEGGPPFRQHDDDEIAGLRGAMSSSPAERMTQSKTTPKERTPPAVTANSKMPRFNSKAHLLLAAPPEILASILSSSRARLLTLLVEVE